MTEKNMDILHFSQLQMEGRLLAGFSHELKNHLAIIKESNGLVSDLLSVGNMQDPALQARIVKLAETINRRVKLIADMAKHLNGFSHRNDTPLSPFQLHDVLDEGLSFLLRFAGLKSIVISVSFPHALPVVYNNPSLIQFIFASLFLHILPSLKPDGKIYITSGREDNFVYFQLQPQGEIADGAPELDGIDLDQALQMALKVVGARLSMQSADGRIRKIVCFVPLTL